MANDWPEVTIESIATRIAMGPFGSDIKTDNFVPKGVPVIRGVNLTNGRFHGEGFVFLTEEKANDLANANAFPGDLVFTHRGTLGQVGLIPNQPFSRYVVSQSQMKLACNKQKALSEFIYYFFKSPAGQAALLANTSQTGVPAISRPVTSLKAIRLRLPPIAEQRAIAHILGTLDDKIELNRKQNETLEAMARALFKDWFVDFGPVRAKMEGREPYLPADLWQLFPDRLDDEGKPEGWEDDCLGSFTNIKNGYAFKSKDWCEAGVPVVKIGSVKPSFVDISQVSFIDVTLAREKESFRLNVGDMLVGLTGYVGETGRIPPTDNRPMLNQRVGKFEPFDSLEPFVFACVRMPDFKVFAESKAHGSAQANVSTTELLKYPVVNPGRELLEAFCRMLEPLFLKSLANEGEQATLSRLRDTLLPKLISGELRVNNADEILETVL